MSARTPLAFVSAVAVQDEYDCHVPHRNENAREDPNMPASSRVDSIVAALCPNAPPRWNKVNTAYVVKKTIRYWPSDVHFLC